MGNRPSASTTMIRPDHSSNPTPRTPDGKLLLLYVLFFLSGMAALVYEVMWMRSFSLVFGSTSRTAAAVLSAFFGGLALGGLLGARLADRRSAAWWRYGVAEIAIGLGALLVDSWVGLFRGVYPHLYPLGGLALTSSKLLLALVAMGIPCVAMGTTLPLVTRAIVATPGHLGRRVGLAYGLNTFGATAGVVLAGFVLPPTVGTTKAVYLAVGLNVLVGIVAIGVALRERAKAGPIHAAESGSEAPRGRTDPAVLALVAGSGFGTVALEVLYTRLLVNATDSSVFSFALMLAVFLVFLALASLAVSWALDRVASPWKLLAWTQSAAVAAILISPALFSVAAPTPPRTLTESLLQLGRQLVLVVGPVILLIGVALPVGWKIAARDAAESGLRVGRLTSLNTLAAVLGSVAAGFGIIPLFGTGGGFVAIALLYFALAFLSWRQGYGRRAALGAGTVLMLLFTLLFTLRTMRAYVILVAPDQQVLRLIEGESVNVAVVEDPRLGRMMKVNNGYVLGRSDDLAVTMQRAQGALPLLLHPEPRSIAFIGVATGVSVSAVLDFPVKRVLAIELLDEVVEATPYFREVNRGVLDEPRVETLVADGRNHLFATDETFDAVVGDLFAPWQAGTGYLYTKEHFTNVAERLAPGGIFVQWLPAHQLSVEEARMITATFLAVFPRAELWLNRPIDRTLGGLALVAEADGAPSPVRRRIAEESAAFPGLRFLCGPEVLRRWSAGAALNSDEFPRIEYSAAVSRFDRTRHLPMMRALMTELEQQGERREATAAPASR